MNRTNIEWTDYTWNPITGCEHDCPYCYARKITVRFPKHYPNGFEPTFYAERLDEPKYLKKPSKIFTVSMGDMFGKWIPGIYHNFIHETIEECPQHIFQILTKAPENISNFPVWPDNVWMGTTLTGGEWPQVAHERIKNLSRFHKGIKFISFEPLLNWGCIEYLCLQDIDWIIVGAQTNPTKMPKKEWVESLINRAEKAGCKIFVKNSIAQAGLIDRTPLQEFPT